MDGKPQDEAVKRAFNNAMEEQNYPRAIRIIVANPDLFSGEDLDKAERCWEAMIERARVR